MDEHYVSESLFEWVVGTIVTIWVLVTGGLYAMLNSRSRITRKEVVEMVDAIEERVNDRVEKQESRLTAAVGQVRADVHDLDTKLTKAHDRILGILLERGG